MSRLSDTRAPGSHVVAFFETDTDLVRDVARFLAEEVKAGRVGVAVATTAHQLAFRNELRRLGVDVKKATSDGSFVMLDAHVTLEEISVDGEVRIDRLDDAVRSLLGQVTGSGREVSIYGEMAQLLWHAGQVGSVIRLESLWNDMQRDFEFSLYCSYHVDRVENDPNSVHPICGLHTAVLDSPLQSGVLLSDVVTFAGGPVSPRKARHYVLGVLKDWKLTDCNDDAALVVSELTTNAVRHAGSPFTVQVTRRGSRLRISVSDKSSRVPVSREMGPGSLSGRGLVLVREVSVDWGYSLTPTGKDVWSELLIQPHSTEKAI